MISCLARTGALRFAACAATAVLCIALFTPAQAHKGATGIVKVRMDAMKELGDHMKALSLMANGRRKYDPKAAKAAAEKMIPLARDMPGQFPKGSLMPPTEALPSIWKDWPRFEKLAQDLGNYAEAFARAAPKTAAAAKPLVANIGGTCSDCHKSYREKKK